MSRQTGAYLAVKRALDVTLSLLALAVGWPVLVAIALAIRIDSNGPSLYRGPRVGRGERIFTILKFRSMYKDADDAPHKAFVQSLLRSKPGEAQPDIYKLADDPRVTRVGRFLRRSSLDELPQLVNVIRGEMSLVGPRPEVPYALEAYEPPDRARFGVLPGITGLWQVSGRAQLSPREMLELDRRYVAECSIWLDLAILMRTIPALLRRRSAA
jgi:lipopolysaccharide/colanic/teichoic acid biosynthesis glycosyltransferase